MRSLRVLHVTPYGAGAWGYGGIPRLSTALARGLAARGHGVTVCTTDACDGLTRLSPPAGARVLRAWPPQRTADRLEVRVFPNVSNQLAYDYQCFLPVGLDRYLKERAGAFDVAHLHACRNVPGLLAARRLRAAGVPYVLAPNGTAPNIERRRMAKRLFDLVAGSGVMAGAARVLAVSEAERRQLLDLGVAGERIRRVDNPVDLSEFSPTPTRGEFRSRLGVTGPLVAFLGKLTPRKRVELLVGAFAGLDLPGVALVIAGNDMGAGSAVRATVRASGAAGRTRFVDLLRGPERLQLLADADVVVYPSEHEIFGLVPLEAILAGTPVVVTNDSGCGEVIASTGGGLVVRGEVEALRAAIAHVLSAREHWRDAAAVAARRVHALYGSDVVCERLEQVYAEVVAA